MPLPTLADVNVLQLNAKRVVRRRHIDEAGEHDGGDRHR